MFTEATRIRHLDCENDPVSILTALRDLSDGEFGATCHRFQFSGNTETCWHVYIRRRGVSLHWMGKGTRYIEFCPPERDAAALVPQLGITRGSKGMTTYLWDMRPPEPLGRYGAMTWVANTVLDGCYPDLRRVFDYAIQALRSKLP